MTKKEYQIYIELDLEKEYNDTNLHNREIKL